MKKAKFEDFLFDVNPAYAEFVTKLHEELLGKGCSVKVESAKNGYVVSYSDPETKKVILNYVFRKKGLMVRIYGDHVKDYIAFMETLPEGMKKDINKASACRRLLDPSKCNSRCSMGYDFILDGTRHQKCRYGGFMFFLSDEYNPFIRTFIEQELTARTA